MTRERARCRGRRGVRACGGVRVRCGVGAGARGGSSSADSAEAVEGVADAGGGCVCGPSVAVREPVSSA
ncbi:hypothetical protein ACFPRL_30230 [Pseudoclavibacter helvolus]